MCATNNTAEHSVAQSVSPGLTVLPDWCCVLLCPRHDRQPRPPQHALDTVSVSALTSLLLSGKYKYIYSTRAAYCPVVVADDSQVVKNINLHL